MRDHEPPPADPRLLAALAKADLDELVTRLLGLARRKMCRRWKGLPPSGETPEDVVQKAFHQALSKTTTRSSDSAEERVRAGEREIAARSAVAALDRAMGDFSPEDRLILQLRFEGGTKVPEIARILGLEQRKVYTRLDHLLEALRQALEEAGLDQAAIGELLDRPALDLTSEPQPERTSTPQSANGRKGAGSNGDGR